MFTTTITKAMSILLIIISKLNHAIEYYYIFKIIVFIRLIDINNIQT